MIRNKTNRDVTTFYNMMDEAENVRELSYTIDYLMDCFRNAIADICEDSYWDIDDLELKYDIM